MNFDENKILEGCIKGDKKSQKSLYEFYSSVLFGLALRYCTSRADAEDVLQESFIKIFQNLNKFQATGPLGAWVRRIVVNTAINHFNKQKTEFLSHNNESYLEVPSNDESVFSSFSTQDLLKSIQELPDGFRMVLNLYTIEGYTHKEISEMLKISEGTSKSQLSRARSLLTEKMAKKHKILSYEGSR